VDQGRGDDRAVQVVARLRRLAGADLGDEAVLEADPAAGDLRAGVVHGDDVGVGEEAHPASSGTSSKRSTSTSAWSAIFKLGITERARNDIVRKGVAPVQPSSTAAAVQAALRSTTSASGRGGRRPATG